MIHRAKLIENIKNHIEHSFEMSDENVVLINELIYALTWSAISNAIAIEAMKPVVEFNNKIREEIRNGQA